MRKMFSACLLLLCVLLSQHLEAQSTQPAEDPLGRSTPHGTATGLIQAVEQGNLGRAAEYLDSRLALSERGELARKLWVVLDRKLITGVSRLSNMPDGDLGDGLSNRDRIGAVESESGSVDMLLDRVQRGQNGAIWLVSSRTLPEIPRLYDEIQPLWIERYVPNRLQTIRWLSVPLYRWIALVVLVPLIFVVAGLSTRALTRVMSPALHRLTGAEYEHKPPGLGPLRLLVLALCFYGASFWGQTLATRHFWHRVGDTLMVMALCWLSLRLLDFVAELSLHRLERVHRSADTALVHLLNRLSKAATVIVAVLVLLYLSDVDLTAALTGLGVGGIAIGFGAQKTIENLFGGIMVISDKPVNVGDVCKAGEFFGTVEDIGIRSTRIRTLNRTVVAVPNGLLAAMSLENFTLRDRFPFQHGVGLARHTTAEQLRLVLEQIRGLLAAHPKVESASARVRFIRFSAAALDLEVFAYVLERDQADFLAIQEELLLGIMDIIDASGSSIAPPPTPAPPAQVRASV